MATFEEFMKVAEISIKDKTSHKRMNEIVRIMRQYKVLHGLTPEQAVEVLQALGPTYVKIGQLASNRSDLLPKAYCDAFEKLRDDANPMPFDVVIEQIDRAYGKSWHEVFASIDPVPLGAASIAQVHKATLLDGTTVAVKVRRPGVAESMAEDIMLMKHLLALGEFASNSHRSILLSLEGFVEEIERTTASEVNFTSELHNLMRFHDELADEQGVTSPVAYPQYSCESVLVMEFVQGTEISHTEELCQQGVDMNALARRVCQSYVTQVLDDGFFHADPHPGNILVRDGDVVWIDLGMVGTLTVSERMLVGKVFTAVATDNAYLLKEAVMGLVHVLGPVDHGALLEALSRLLAEYSTAEMKEINVGTVLTEVIEVLRGQNMMMTSSVTMLARGFVTIEGVMAQVAPDISVIEIVSKHVIAQHADPKFLATQLIDSRHDERRFGRGLGEAADPAVEHVGDARPRADQGERRHRGVLAHPCHRLRLGGSHIVGAAVGGAVPGVVYPVHHGYAAATARRAPARRAGLCRRLRAGCLHGVPHPGLPPSPSQQRGAAVGVCNVVSTGGRRRGNGN